ncbi:MAG: hypothetical protein H6581_26700 [Bacteroidia bacterium]|nr:hypothetical protein [Bacteroidia bacterium]
MARKDSKQMEPFEDFVKEAVRKWQVEKGTILKRGGLAGLSNREYGDQAEVFVKGLVEALTPNYSASITPGSQSPADIMAICQRRGFWHLMLIQVKSSMQVNNIYRLTPDDKKVFRVFARFLKKEIVAAGLLGNSKVKDFVVSFGYAGVVRSGDQKRPTHELAFAEYYDRYKSRNRDFEVEGVMELIRRAHLLGMKKRK